MRHRLTLGLMFLALYAMPAIALIRAPATRPAPVPQTPGDLKNIKHLIIGLADESYPKREESRIALMGLKRSDLGTLYDVVKHSLPLEPSQSAVLRDVVTHVYLSGEKYETVEGIGFLGVSMASGNRNDDAGLFSIDRGIAIVSRVPGFCAYRMLQTGDVILATVSPKHVEFKSTDPYELFLSTVKGVGPGQTLTFEVLRQVRIINVSLTLDERPRGLENPTFIIEFTQLRAEKADEYWKKVFAPLLNDPVG
jgi:hypothetical protein